MLIRELGAFCNRDWRPIVASRADGRRGRNALAAEVARRRRAAGLDGDDPIEADRDSETEPNALLRVVARRRRAANAGANALQREIDRRVATARTCAR